MDNSTRDQPNAETHATAALAASDPPAPAERAGQAGDRPSAAASAASEPPKAASAAHDTVFTRLDDVRLGGQKAPATTLPSLIVDRPRARRIPSLAATIAIAAAVGAMAGSIATAGLGAIWSDHSAQAAAIDAAPLRDSIARIDAQLGVLKTALDKSDKSATVQLARLGDRFDRLERGQAEPAAKLAKLADAVDRIEHGAAARDITGSIAAAPPQPPAPAAQPARPAGPPVLDGWIVRRVYNGAALIQGRFGGVIEVEPGDNLPGLGRIETIRRQDGRWVVMTSRGMIVAR
ncbi:MAG TPA: hypothetical protein VLX44_09865 [Xanthobacteraceae bacterium]|nr:hypothetical protein [Xanthobacteraceae bacterium]